MMMINMKNLKYAVAVGLVALLQAIPVSATVYRLLITEYPDGSGISIDVQFQTFFTVSADWVTTRQIESPFSLGTTTATVESFITGFSLPSLVACDQCGMTVGIQGYNFLEPGTSIVSDTLLITWLGTAGTIEFRSASDLNALDPVADASYFEGATTPGYPFPNGVCLNAGCGLSIAFRESVPEPASLALIAVGLAGIGFCRRKQS
jgi:hypothetical protein